MTERGNGKLGCLLVSLVAIGFAFISYRTAPVYLDKIDLEEDLSRIASRAGAEGWEDRFIIGQVVLAGKGRDFEIRPSNVVIERESRFSRSPKLKIDVSYQRKVDYFGYVHVFSFHAEVTSLLGRL